MATIGKELAVRLLINDGWYPGDPQCDSIYSYWNPFANKTCYAVYYSTHEGPYGPYCEKITLLWKKGFGLTEDGKKLCPSCDAQQNTENEDGNGESMANVTPS